MYHMDHFKRDCKDYFAVSMNKSYTAPDGFRLIPESKLNGKETRKAHEARRIQKGRQEGLLTFQPHIKESLYVL